VLPLDDPRIYPVSGGSEAVETAIKLARAFHLARGENSRTLVIGRRPSYHGNTLGALDAGGKEALRRPYEPWLGRFEHVDAAYEFRCPNPDHPAACGVWHAERLDRAIVEAGPSTVAAFIAEPVAGATLAAAVPTDDYWPAIAEVCRRHGVLLIADEVMTEFGRTGRWFGVDHWGVRPDLLTVGKGSTSGYSVRVRGVHERGVRDRAPDRVRPRVHVVAQWRGRGGRPRGVAAPVRGRPGGGERAPRGAVAEVALIGVGG
jgi:adenosylmethionine-8-amino-7-oxononanoate aminotransferase